MLLLLVMATSPRKGLCKVAEVAVVRVVRQGATWLVLLCFNKMKRVSETASKRIMAVFL